MYRYLLRLSGEIALKGKMRGVLEQILVRNMSKVLSQDVIDIRRIDGGRIYIEAKNEISDVLSRFFGVVEVLEVFVEDSRDLNELAKRIRDLLCGSLNGKKFAVRARRSGVIGYTSLDAARIIGGALLECSGGVDLENPDIEAYVEIRVVQHTYLHRSSLEKDMVACRWDLRKRFSLYFPGALTPL